MRNGTQVRRAWVDDRKLPEPGPCLQVGAFAVVVVAG
jgi:hypothetical protein